MPDRDRSLIPASGRRRPARRVAVPALAAAACTVATLGLVRDAAAQSPFTQPPSRSGGFTLPQPQPARPGPGSPFGQTMPRPSPSRTAPLPALPTEEGAARRGPLPPVEALPSLSSPLPLPTGEQSLVPRALPPGPEVAPPLEAVSTAPVPRAEPIVLRTGLVVTLRVCQVFTVDGLTPGERLLNSRPAIQRGDCFLAEVIEPCPPYPILVGGTITEITPPRRFGHPGYVSIQMVQLVQTAQGGTGWTPWRMDLTDRRFATKMRRVLLTTLLGLEGAGMGASIGAQFSSGNMAFIGAGMGIGALVGFGYASFMRGTEANFEPGDTIEITVGSTRFRPVPREWQTILYPAVDAGSEAWK